MAATTATLLGAGGSFVSSIYESDAQRRAGEFEKMQHDTNARLAELQAKDAITRGEKEAQIIKDKTKQKIGSQRAALAASGIEVNSGSALKLQEDVAADGAEDVLTTKNNAWRQAFGYKQESIQSKFRGRIAESQAKFNANATLVTGGLSAINSGITTFNSLNKLERSKK